MDYIVPSRFDPEVSSHSIHTLQVGLTASDVRRVLHTDISRYVALSRDRNPIHSNPEYAHGTRFGQEIALGLLPEGILTSLLGTKLPGQGAIYVGKTVSFKAPVHPGDQLTTIVRIEKVDRDRRLVSLAGECSDQNQKVVAEYSVMLMLDKGQELEFLCDLFKFAAERDPCDPDFRKTFIDDHALGDAEKLARFAGALGWQRHPSLVAQMSAQLGPEGAEAELGRKVLALSDAQVSTEHLLDVMIWWSVLPTAFSILTEQLGHDSEAAAAKILAWSRSMDCGGERVALSGLERLNDVELRGGAYCFNPVSENEVTNDLTARIGEYVARNLV